MDTHRNKAPTVRFNDTDKKNIERVKELYACTSDIAAIRTALQVVAQSKKEARHSSHA